MVGMRRFTRAARIVHMGVRMLPNPDEFAIKSMYAGEKIAMFKCCRRGYFIRYAYVCWLVLAVCSAATAQIKLPEVSVYVEDSPVAQDLLEQASRLRHENRLADAVAVYRQILEQYPRKLTKTGNGLHADMAGWVRGVVLSDEDLLTSYRRVFNSQADRELEEITSPVLDEHGLARVLEMYWLCPAGLEAGFRLAGIYLERGDIALAGSVLAELEEHPDLSTRKKLWHRLQAAVGVFGEDLDRYEKHLAALLSLGEVDAAAEVNRWVDRLELPVVAELFHSFDVLPAVMIPDPLGVPLWEKELVKKSDRAVQAIPVSADRSVYGVALRYALINVLG